MNTFTERKTEFSNQLYQTYNWFEKTFTEAVKVSFNEFFNIAITPKLFSLCENDNILLKGDKYFVTRVKIKKNLDVTLKLSQTSVEKLLDSALGSGEKQFRIEEVSELEAKIITAFNEFVFNNFKNAIIPAEQIDKNATPKSFCNILFCLKQGETDYGKLLITIPTNILNPEPITPGQDVFQIGDFKSCNIDMKIKVGASKLTLGEVKSLNKDDILLLEDSNIYTMVLCYNGIELPFKISPDPSIITDTDNEGENMAENTTPANNLWDSIQVDINAEFEKVKISLGELKQISEGLVVDIGSIYDNKIDLKVENKLVARGELVILNDRYGVRIDEVINEPDEETVHTQEIQPQDEPQAEEAVSEKDFEDDDFNYDDFEENNDI